MRRLFDVLFILLSLSAITVSAYVHETTQQTVSQRIENIATLTVRNAALGTIEEGETKDLTKNQVGSLGNIINVTTTKAPVYLNFDSNVDVMNAYYTSYTITVKYAAVPSGSSKAVGNTACSMTIASPDSAAVDLDVSGSWRFDFDISMTARSVSSDTNTEVTITITAPDEGTVVLSGSINR